MMYRTAIRTGRRKGNPLKGARCSRKRRRSHPVVAQTQKGPSWRARRRGGKREALMNFGPLRTEETPGGRKDCENVPEDLETG